MSQVLIKVFSVFTLTMLVLGLKAQSSLQVLEIGDRYFDQADYYGAKFYYKKAMEIDSSNAEVLYKYARSLEELSLYDQASRYFYKASLIDRGVVYQDVYYRLAESYRSSGDYRKARRFYSKALIPYRRDKNSYWYKRINQSKQANKWAMTNSTQNEYAPTNLGKEVNTTASEFAPFIIDNQLIYSALLADSNLEGNRIRDNHYYNRIYTQTLKEGSTAKEIRILNAKNDLAEKHIGNFSFDKETKEAYFSVCDTNFKCEIWKGKFNQEQGIISNSKPLNNNINDGESNNTQAAVYRYKNDTYLLFVSDRPRGFGGLDLWISKKAPFGFDVPKNLGSAINTLGDEISPYYDVNSQRLYFSSNWHNGFGGYDIFSAKGTFPKFNTSENLGTGINSPADDYYFILNEKKALFSSNRKDGLGNSNSCCNDLYLVAYETEDTTAIIEDAVADTVISVASLNKYLPLDLYFHNDVPDPNSKDTTTNKNYLNLARAYYNLKEEYIAKNLSYAKEDESAFEVRSYFEDELMQGIEDLQFFTPLLEKELKKGSNIILTIKGYASNVAAADYNLSLTLRRIESLINYFKSYNNGSLLPYLENRAENKGSLKINKIPFGEFASKIQIDEDDKIAAIYDLDVAKQRKIELVALSENPSGLKNFDDREDFKAAKISFNSKLYDLGKVDDQLIERSFILSNNGNDKLQIFNVVSNCDCVKLNYPEVIAPGTTDRLMIQIDPSELEGTVELRFLVVSNTAPNLNELSIKLVK